MTETTGYLCIHPKCHLQHQGNQLWLRSTISERPFSEGGRFEKLFYPVFARFGSIFACILFVLSRHHTFCQWLRQGQFFSERPVLPRRKQATGRVPFVPNIISGMYQCCQEQSCLTSIDPKLFKCHILQWFEVFEDCISMWNTISIHIKNYMYQKHD